MVAIRKTSFCAGCSYSPSTVACTARSFEKDWTCIDPDSQQRVRLFALIHTAMEPRLAMVLVRSEIKMAVRRDGERVGPQDARVVGDRLPFAIRPAPADAVVLIVASVDAPFVVRLKAVRGTLFAKVGHGVPRVGSRAIAQESRWNRVQVAAGKGTVIQCGSVGGESDAVRSREVGHGRSPLLTECDAFAFHNGSEHSIRQ